MHTIQRNLVASLSVIALAACGSEKGGSGPAAPPNTSGSSGSGGAGSGSGGAGSDSGGSGGSNNASGGNSGSGGSSAASGGTGNTSGTGGYVEPPPIGDPGRTAKGDPGVWEQLDLPGAAAGDQFQSLANDPVRPGDFYYASGHNGDQRAIKWWKSTDYGATWALINNTDMHGDPWGFSIDPNPDRDPDTNPTLWSPAGYGDMGAWKSVDGGRTWVRSPGADLAFAEYNPYGATATDLYHLQILPDDPPNHVLATYHYAFKDADAGGFGETWDGGETWVVHPPVPGMGTSHYVIPISATTWCVINQEDAIWRTTTAGRVGGTAAQKFRDGTISTDAWEKVDDIFHAHGSHTNAFIAGAWYVPGINSMKKTSDEGETWQTVASGFSISAVAGTDRYIYGSYGFEPALSRAPIDDETNWDRAYAETPAGMTSGPSPFGMGSGYNAEDDEWVVLVGSWETGLWRYVEPK